jgi:mRNA-degrading endonuclease RelE of RelBE toxin-antitoxin system
MLVIVKKSFNKDIEKVNDKKLAIKIKEVIDSLQKAEAIIDIPNTKKLKGSANAYRIRIGAYRLGFFLTENVIELTVFLHRKDMYKIFP